MRIFKIFDALTPINALGTFDYSGTLDRAISYADSLDESSGNESEEIDGADYGV